MFSIDSLRIPASYFNQLAVKGEIITTGSLEAFKKMDKNGLIQENFNLDNVQENPKSLVKFLILAYPVSVFDFPLPILSQGNRV